MLRIENAGSPPGFSLYRLSSVADCPDQPMDAQTLRHPHGLKSNGAVRNCTNVCRTTHTDKFKSNQQTPMPVCLELENTMVFSFLYPCGAGPPHHETAVFPEWFMCAATQVDHSNGLFVHLGKWTEIIIKNWILNSGEFWREWQHSVHEVEVFAQMCLRWSKKAWLGIAWNVLLNACV